MDELSVLAVEVVVADLHATVEGLLLDPGLDWTSAADVSALCRNLVEHVVRNQSLFDMIARWRYSDEALGVGIRTVIDADCLLVEWLLEQRWRHETGHTRPFTSNEHTAVVAHALVIHDDAHTVARLAYAPTMTRFDHDDVAAIMHQRLVAGWVGFTNDMNERIARRRAFGG